MALDRAIPDVEELREIFGGVKHARFHDPDIVYHVLLRVFQGLFLLRPDRKGHLNDIIAGVIGRAQELWPEVRLYAHAWLSSHAHMLLQGPSEDIPRFTGFIEREISRRWGVRVNWPGTMWQTYESTALPTAESQRRAFAYVLAQSTKENLVDSPLKWPGVHCARELTTSRPRRGIWFDGTSYGKARHAQKECLKPKAVHRRDFVRHYTVRLERLPALSEMSDEQYRLHVVALVEGIERDAARERKRTGRKVLGRRRILQMPRFHRSPLPRPPWYVKRRRMIVWAERLAEETLVYLRRYWQFQRDFREASQRFCNRELTVPFPAGAFRPPVFAG